MPAAAGVTRGTFPSTSRAAYGDAASKRIVDPEEMRQNILQKVLLHKTLRLMPLRAMCAAATLTASQKCPCKQAFLLHGIIGHGIPLVCNCTFTYRVRENDAKRHSPTCARGQTHGITLIRNCKFTYRVCENDAKRHSPTCARGQTHGITLIRNCKFTYRVRENDAKRH